MLIILILAILCSFRQGRFGITCQKLVILCFRQGRLAFRAKNFGYPLFFQAGKILALRAKNWLSSVSGREG